MPIFKWNKGSKEEQVAREAKIKSIMPKVRLSIVLGDRILKDMQPVLLRMLKKEIRIYKEYPKEGKYEPKAFNPRNQKKCFMGQGFEGNGKGLEGWYDADLVEYRKMVGTFNHKEWGDCTLMEIWAGDHFEAHTDMVVRTFMYCWGDVKRLPKLKFYINPFFKNEKSSTMEHDEEDKSQSSTATHYTKLANYIEIRGRLKKAGIEKLMELGETEEDDPKPRRRSHIEQDDDDEDGE